MNRKGFTLVELLATIALIAVIMLLFIPTIGNLVSKFQNDDKIEMLNKSAIMAAKEYIIDGKANVSITCNNSITQNIDIEIADLKTTKYLESDDEYYENKKVEVTYSCATKTFTEYIVK